MFYLSGVPFTERINRAAHYGHILDCKRVSSGYEWFYKALQMKERQTVFNCTITLSTSKIQWKYPLIQQWKKIVHLFTLNLEAIFSEWSHTQAWEVLQKQFRTLLSLKEALSICTADSVCTAKRNQRKTENGNQITVMQWCQDADASRVHKKTQIYMQIGSANKNSNCISCLVAVAVSFPD